MNPPRTISGRDKIISCLRFLKVRKESYTKVLDIQLAHLHLFNENFTEEVCEAYFGTRNFWTAVNTHLSDILLYAMKPGGDYNDYYQVLRDFSSETPIKVEYFSKTFRHPSRGCLRYYDGDDEFRGLVLNPFKVPSLFTSSPKPAILPTPINYKTRIFVNKKYGSRKLC